MLYLIGMGLNNRGITKEGLMALDRCHTIYVEGYTVDFPYDIKDLHFGRSRHKVKVLKREDVESNLLIKEAKSKRIGLLIYGSPLFATTHYSLIKDANEQGVRTHVIYSASVFDGLGELGLELYKFGKIASMPKWTKTHKPCSFIDIVKENKSIRAHSLILSDIGLVFEKAVVELESACKLKKIKLDKVVVCSKLGTDEPNVYYGSIDYLKKIDNVEMPFCFIIPCDDKDLHFVEKQALETIGL